MPRKVIITCAVTGAIHTPVDVAVPAGHARRDRRVGHRRGRGGRRHRAPARTQPGRRQPVPGPGAVPAVPAADQGREQRGHQPHHRRRAARCAGRAAAPGARVQARGGVAEHGLDEHGPVPHAQPLQGVQARLGGALPRGQPRPHLQEHLHRHRAHPASRAATTARASRSSATTSATSTPRRTSSSAG